jgi:peptide/nickel transport system permease protein
MSLSDAPLTAPVPSGEAAHAGRRRTRRRRRTGTLGAAILATAVVVALGAPLLAPVNPLAQDLLLRLRSPGAHGPAAVFWLGTDGLGRDVLSRLLFGTRASLVVAGLAVACSGAVGTALGMLAAYYRGWIGAVLMRFVDMVLSIPFLLLAIAVVAVLGPSLSNTVLVLGLTRWPRYARVAFAQTLAARRREFVEAARALGSSDGRLMTQHVLPEVLPSAVVVATLEVGLMIVFEASLSFLGLGVQPPTPSWGSMLADGRDYLATAWWLATFPGLAIMVTVLGANLLGDAVRDRLDPRVR